MLKGGETAFPETTDADWWDAAAMPEPRNVSSCARGHVYAVPRLGDALLFYSQPPGTESLSAEARNKTNVDKNSMHTGAHLNWRQGCARIAMPCFRSCSHCHHRQLTTTSGLPVVSEAQSSCLPPSSELVCTELTRRAARRMPAL